MDTEIKIEIRKKAEKSLKALPKDIQKRFWKQIDIFKQDPSYPSLDLRPLLTQNVKGGMYWRIRINSKYRAILFQCFNEKGEPTNQWEVVEIGKHDILEKFSKYVKRAKK